MALTKVSGGILDPGINVAGIVTATGFDGPFTGGSSKNITAGIITATELDVNGNGDISGNLVVGGNLTANGDFTTLNTTLREVEILHVDANSSVAAGIITQRGSGNILEFFDTSSNVGALTDEGNLGLGANLTSPNVKLHVKSTATGGGNIAYFDDTGSGNTGRLMILTTGGAATDGVKLQAVNRKYIHFGNATNQLTIDNNNSRVGIGSDIPDYSLDVIGSIGFSGQTRAASGSQGAPSYSFDGDSDTGMYRGGVNILSFATAGSEALHIDSSGNVNITNDIDVDGHTNLDNVSISGVTTATGNITISSAHPKLLLTDDTNPDFSVHVNATAFHIRNETDNRNEFRILSDGTTELHYAGTKKFETGNTVNINSNHFEITSGQQLRFDNSNDNRSSEILNTGSSGNSTLAFKTNGGTRWTIDSSGHFIPGAAATYDIGSTSAEIGNVYLADSKHIYFGNEQDLDIRFDSSNAAITLDTGTLSIINYANNEDVKILSDSGGGGVVDYIVADGSTGEVLLNHYGSQKLATSTTGISVTGEVAASQDYPNFRPTLDLNFAAEKKLDSRITYTRTGPASFVNEFGKLVLVGDNVPRFDHDPTTRESKGLLIEESRTNYQPYSVDMSQGANNNEVTVENNAAIAPDGTMSASKITGGTNQSTSQRLGWGTQGVNSSTHTQWSIWVKSEETSCIVQIYSNTYTIGASHMNIELADGTTQGTTPNSTFRFNIKEYPNKWWRISWGGVGNAGGNSGGMYLAVVPSMSSTRAATTGSAHSKVWFAWGLQEEVASTAQYSTSYIPTNGSIATRGKDLAEIDGEEFTDFFNQDEGTINCAYWLGDDNSGMRIFQINDSNNSVIDIIAGSGSGSGGYGYVNTGGVAQANGGQSSTNANYLNNLHVVTLAYKANDIAGINRNTGVLTTDTSATLDGAYNRVTFYQGSTGGDQLNGHFQRVQYYPKRLPDNQLKNLNN
tara:strand:+ start:1952 stop:4843 length:2892 start_codon:yes stop_codon:yes gene_type:complete